MSGCIKSDLQPYKIINQTFWATSRTTFESQTHPNRKSQQTDWNVHDIRGKARRKNAPIFVVRICEFRTVGDNWHGHVMEGCVRPIISGRVSSLCNKLISTINQKLFAFAKISFRVPFAKTSSMVEWKMHTLYGVQIILNIDWNDWTSPTSFERNCS